MSTLLLQEDEKPGWRHFLILIVNWCAWLFAFNDLMLFVFLTSTIGSDLKLSSTEVSLSIGVSLVSASVGGIIFGVVSDRFGRRVALQWVMIVCSVGTFLCAFASGFISLVIFRIISGFGVGGGWATCQTYVCEVLPAKFRARYAAVLTTSGPAGAGLASIVYGFLAPVYGWRLCFIISSLPILLAFLAGVLPESSLWLKSKVRQVGGSREEIKNGGELFLKLFSGDNIKPFFKSLLLVVLGMGAYWFFYSWLTDYLHGERHFSSAVSGELIFLSQIGAVIGYITFGFFADRFGRRPAISMFSFIMALGLLKITVLWDFIISGSSAVYASMFLVGMGSGFLSGYGPLLSELFPTEIRNTALGSVYNLARGVQFFTPLVMDMISRQLGLSGAIAPGAVLALLSAFWIWIFPETKGRILQ